MKVLSCLMPLTLLLVAVCLSSSAQTAPDQLGPGFYIGCVKPADRDITPGFGVVLDIRHFRPAFEWEMEGSYWSHTETYTAAYGSDMESSTRDIALSHHIKYQFTLPKSPVKTYVGGGIGVHFLRTETRWPDFGETETVSETKLGYHFLAGCEAGVTSLVVIFTEVRFSLVPDANQFAILWGAKFNLGSWRRGKGK